MDNVHRAYDRLFPDYSIRATVLNKELDTLIELSRIVESTLVQKMKPFIALSLKWKFDFLCKTLGSPFELKDDVRYWIKVIEMLKTLGDQEWFDIADNKAQAKEPWVRTAEGFDLGWTTTTDGERYEISRKIAKERLDQIIEMLGGSEYIKGKEVLDSGCGPGRYVDILSHYGPKTIVGLDQGARLINVLNERFKGDPRIEIVHGTCEKLTFPDESFDFVISNGVMHHTPSNLQTMIKDHARVLRKGGVMFIMLIGKGGLELKMWQFLRNFLYDVPLEVMLETFGSCISPLRLQGVVDHMYGEYQETSRDEFESWCSSIFTRIERVPGIAGLDVTPELYEDDSYFHVRFGCGQLRYLCYK
jgi:ubiquinone/menaquinone biosynthesis C-methylase UbiE